MNRKKQLLTQRDVINEGKRFEKLLEKFGYWVVFLHDDFCMTPKFGFHLTLATTNKKTGYLDEVFEMEGFDLYELENKAIDFAKNFIS